MRDWALSDHDTLAQVSYVGGEKNLPLFARGCSESLNSINAYLIILLFMSDTHNGARC